MTVVLFKPVVLFKLRVTPSAGCPGPLRCCDAQHNFRRWHGRAFAARRVDRKSAKALAGNATPGREAAGLVVAKKLVGDDVLRAACVEIAKLRFDRDADSVDGSPTFEVSWVRQGKYCHSGLARVFKQTIEEKLTPLIRSVSHLHGMADSRGLVLCDALVRSYDEGQRRQHPALRFSGLGDRCARGRHRVRQPEGPGFYVQPGGASLQASITMSSGDVIALV